MGRIAFVQHSLLEKMSVMAISSILKKHGHVCDVFCLNGEKDIYKSLFDFKPDIVAYSMYIGEQKEALDIKKCEKNRSKYDYSNRRSFYISISRNHK